MAEKFDIFAGSYVSVYYNSNVDNTQFDSDDFIEIPETGAFPQTGIEREVITAPNYTHRYSLQSGQYQVQNHDQPVYDYICEYS